MRSALFCLLLGATQILGSVSAAADHDHDSGAAAAVQRVLQGGDESGFGVTACNNDSTPILGGSLQELFAPQLYDAACNCTDNSNLQTIADLGMGEFNIDLLNEAISNLVIYSKWDCRNQCDICFPDNTCGVFSADYLADYNGIESNITIEELLGGEFDPDTAFASLVEGSLEVELCLEYSTGQIGTVCWGANLDLETQTDVNATERPCYISYNGVNCNSCTETLPDGCWIADCSNHGETEMVNTCLGTGIAGLFQPIAYFSGGFVDRAELTSGCQGSRPLASSNATFCGGIAAFLCPDGLTCVDDPTDDCDPTMGGADCGGICVDSTPPAGTLAPSPAPVNATEAPTSSLAPVAAPTTTPTKSMAPSYSQSPVAESVTTFDPVPDLTTTPPVFAPTTLAPAPTSGAAKGKFALVGVVGATLLLSLVV